MQRPRLHVPPCGGLALLADFLMTKIVMPSKRITIPGESPQLTHWWNNVKVSRNAVAVLHTTDMVAYDGDSNAIPRKGWWDTKFHRGGWKKYVVLEPTESREEWFVGWIGSVTGVSQIPISSRVRVLRGPNDGWWFGIRATDYQQIALHRVGEGELGDGGPFRQLPLH